MGCGLSKSDATGVTIRSAGRHLLFVRRIEEIRRRRTSRKLKDTTPSRKTLLVHVGGEDDENVSNHQTVSKNARKSLSSLEDTESCVTSEGSKGEANKATEASSGKDGSSRTKGRDGEREKKTVYVTKDEVKVEEGVDGDTEDEGEDDDERMISHQEGEENFPGSPSFRVYFLNNLKGGDDGDGDGDGDGKDNGLNISSQSEDAAFPEVSEIKKVKKGRKGWSFKRGKNLLNVWSCQSVQV